MVPFRLICISISFLSRIWREPAIDHLHHLLAVTSAPDGLSGKHIAKFTRIVRGEFDICTTDILSEAVQLGGAGDRHNAPMVSMRAKMVSILAR
jgi:hypothetical protein